MKRMLIITATAVGAVCAAAIPAFAGLSGNPTFSHKVPVTVPSDARLVQIDDHGRIVDDRPARSDDGPSGVPSPSSTTEPGDDKGGLRVHPTDDSSPSVGPDDSSTSPSSGVDDHGRRHGGHGSDDSGADDHGGHGRHG